MNIFKQGFENKKNIKNKNLINKLVFTKKENKTPNKIIPIKTRTHIKIKSRDLNHPELNLKTENNIYNYHKPQLRPNKTLNNLTTLKINREKKLKINIINRHNLDFSNNKKNEIYKKILTLWKELGVNYIYQSIFNQVINDLNEKEKNDYFKYEFDKLNNVYNIVQLIKNDIKNRENIIFQLQTNYNNKIDKKNFDEETIKQIISIFNDIRKYSLDIIHNILLLKKEIGFDLSTNKYDINKFFLILHLIWNNLLI